MKNHYSHFYTPIGIDVEYIEIEYIFGAKTSIPRSWHERDIRNHGATLRNGLVWVKDEFGNPFYVVLNARKTRKVIYESE